MRKLAFTAIITILALIALISYVKYDTRRFIESLPKSPLTMQQIDSTATEARENASDGVTETEQVIYQNISASSLNGTPKNTTPLTEILVGGKVDAPELDYVSEVPDLSPVLTDIPNPGLSPVLEKVFTEIHPFFQQVDAIGMELGPLRDKLIARSQRQQEILKKVDATTDKKKKGELLEEFNTSTKLNEKLGKIVMKLQEEIKLPSGEVERILNEYGFPSGNDFFTEHLKTYEIWASEQ